jgi:hypothetical protein
MAAGTTGRSTDLSTNRTSVAHRAERLSTETKQAFKTTEFFVYVAMVIAVWIAGAVVDGGDSGGNAGGLGANDTWLYVTLLTIGYLISRGLAKSGSRDPYWGGGTNESRFTRDDDER